MAGTQIGPRIGIEGEKEYRAQIQQIIQQTKTLDSAMEKTSSAWDKNTSALTRNKAQAQSLSSKIELTKSKLAAQNEMLEASKRKFGENATQTMKWQQAVDSTSASLNRMQTELRSIQGAASLSSLSTGMADFGTKLQNIGQSLQSLGTKLTMAVTLPIAAVSKKAIELGSDMAEAGNKVDVVFGSMSESVKEFASTTTDMYAISEGKALQMAGDYGAMATSMGMSQAEAANLATEMTALAGDMASFHNKSLDIAASSLKGVFTGETESLKQFGVAMTQTNLEEFAAKQGKVYDKMSQAEKVMTRYQYLLTTQSDALGDAGRTMGEFAGSTRHMEAALQDAGAALGEALIPIILPIIQAVTNLAKKFAQLPEPVQKVIAAILLVAAAVGPLLILFGALMSSIGGLLTGIPALTAALAGAAPAMAAFSAAAGPVIAAILGIVVVLAAAFAAGYLLAKNWDSIADAAKNMGTKIASAGSDIADFFQKTQSDALNFEQALISVFASLPGKIIQALKDSAKAVKEELSNMVKNAKESGAHFIEGLIAGIKEKIGKVVETVKKVAKTVQDFLGFSRPDKGPLHEYEIWMPHFMQGLAKGIRGNMGLVTNAMKNVSSAMALPLSSNAPMNMALAGAGGDGYSSYVGGTSMNVYVDHISELNDLIRIQNQAQQRYRMGAK